MTVPSRPTVARSARDSRVLFRGHRELLDLLAGRLLGYPRVGLATLVETVLGLRMRKEHSAADWSTRPLPKAWLDYAALDAAVNEGVEAARAFLLVTTPIKDVKARIQALSDLRLAVKKARPEWAQFGPGWTARIGERVVARANALA